MLNILDVIADSEYPGKYFDFSDGVPISDYETNSFIQTALHNLQRNIVEDNYPSKSFTNISTGNTKVLVEAYQNERGSNVYSIEISVIKSYAKKSFTVEINK